MALVAPNLFLGSPTDATDAFWLERNSIRVILKVDDSAVDAETLAFYTRLGITFMFVPLEKNGNYSTPQLKMCHFCLKSVQSPILVYCDASRSRSVAVIATWRMVSEQRMASPIMRELMRIEPAICMDQGWRMALRDLDAHVISACALDAACAASAGGKN